MKPTSKTESEQLLASINEWMQHHHAFDNKSTLIQIAIAEFVLNRTGKTLFA